MMYSERPTTGTSQIMNLLREYKKFTKHKITFCPSITPQQKKACLHLSQSFRTDYQDEKYISVLSCILNLQ